MKSDKELIWEEYVNVEPTKETKLDNGSKIEPVATLKDQYGGIAHIWIDDNCYVLGLEKDSITTPTYHIFKEAFEVLKKLPSLN